MKNQTTMNTKITLKEAYKIMFNFLDKEWESQGESKTDQLGGILSNLSLWETESGNKEPIDASVFPKWLESAEIVLSNEGYKNCDIKINGQDPNIKVNR